MSEKLLNINIDYINIDQAVEKVSGWLKKRGKHYVVTPNPEMLVDASFDREFTTALNSSDLAIPDSSRLGWGSYIKKEKSWFLRLIYSPFVIMPHLLPRFDYPTTPGIDLMERILSLSIERGLTTAYLGGTKRVADKLSKCLRLKYPGLKIVFCSGNMLVNHHGDIQFDSQTNKMTQSKEIREGLMVKGEGLSHYKNTQNSFNYHLLTSKVDILFVAFGHRKQEKWMYKNLSKLNTRVMMGVGGSFDYLVGEVPRAPLLLRQAGFEWIFRFIIQPSRIRRLWKLIYFIYLVNIKKW